MNLCKAREVNEYILEKAIEKLEERVKVGGWSNEEFEVMSKSIENIREIEKIEYKNDKEDMNRKLLMKKMDAETETTEFESLVYKIVEGKPSNEAMIAITTIIADHMEDMRILNKRAYDLLMMKLKELL